MDTVIPFPLRRDIDLREDRVHAARIIIARPEICGDDALRAACQTLKDYGDYGDVLEADVMLDALDRRDRATSAADMKREVPELVAFVALTAMVLIGFLSIGGM